MIEELTRAEKATAPPKRWRNRWLAHVDWTAKSGEFYRKGEHWGRRVWPSRDAAESHAMRQLANPSNVLRQTGQLEWLGAFPVDE